MGWDIGKLLRNSERYTIWQNDFKKVWRCSHEYSSFSKIFYRDAETLPSIQMRRARQTVSQSPLNTSQWVIQYLPDVGQLSMQEGRLLASQETFSFSLLAERRQLPALSKLQKCFWIRLPYWNLLWTCLFGKQFPSNILQIVLQLAIITQSNNPRFLKS